MVQTLGLNSAQIAAVKFYTPWHVQRVDAEAAPSATGQCDWLLTTPSAWAAETSAARALWQEHARVVRPTERRDFWLLLQRQP